MKIKTAYHSFGNSDILSNHSVGFLCSRSCSAQTVLDSYDWARIQRDKGVCVVSGNHSQIEKDVFQILLKGKQPVILVLARALKSKWEPEIQEALDDSRLLVISPFDEEVKRVTRDTAEIRNRFIMENSDSLHVAYAEKGGMIEKLMIRNHQKI